MFPLGLLIGGRLGDRCHALLGLLDGCGACGLLLRQLRGGGFLVGLELRFCSDDELAPILFLLRNHGCHLDFVSAPLGGELFVLGVHVLHGIERGLDLLVGGDAVEDTDKQLLHELAVIRNILGQFGDGVGRITDGIADGRSADEGHDGAKLNIVAALALAGAFANGAAEVVQEAVGELDLGIGKLSGAGAGLHAGDLAHGAGDGVDGVVEHFRGQAAGFGVGVVDLVVRVPFVGRDAELVGARLADDLHEVADVEAAVDELLGEVAEQLRIARRIAGADVVERLNHAGAGEVTPDAVRVAHREVLIVRAGHPGGEFFATAGVGLLFKLGHKGEGRWRVLAGAQVLDFAFAGVLHDFVKRNSSFNGGAADGFTSLSRIALKSDLRKERGGLVILVLVPALEGMVVALVAVEAGGEEEVGGVLHRLFGLAQDLEVGGGGIGLVGTARGED